jgi:heptosyltransferase-3
MKTAVVCAPGLGDALILHIVSYHLSLQGHQVTTISPHRFGKWLEGYTFASTADLTSFDAIFLQHDNSLESKQIQQLDKKIYTFYGGYEANKHGPLKVGFDYVSDLNKSMVDNVVLSLKELFSMNATKDNGFRPPALLSHRKFKRRVIIHHTSGDAKRNWPLKKFQQVAAWLEKKGYEPVFIPQFPNLEDLISFIYESAFFIGNDSGPGHIASCLQIPHLIIGRQERHMRHWRPGWKEPDLIYPPRWIPNWKGCRLRDIYWKKWITTDNVINLLKSSTLKY